MPNRNAAIYFFLTLSATILSPILLQSARGWAIGSETAVTNEHVAHQWIAQEGWKLFNYQFGPSEIDSYVGAPTEYPNGPNTGWIEGVYDEDIRGENPFKYTADANHPSLRHFWAPHTIGWARDYDDGLYTFDSAPNMAIKYFTGGYGFKGSLDSAWGDNPSATVGQGIPQVYSSGATGKGTAYYYFGHTIHLLGDLAVPAHSHADAHLESSWQLANDPDPVHDYVDGTTFDSNGNNGLPSADFDDVNPTRYKMWKFQGGAVGRPGVIASMRSGDLPSPQQVTARYNNDDWPSETMQSVPSGYNAAMLPMYILYAETAREAAHYDTKDYNGQSDQGSRNSDYRTFDFGYYNNFTRTEIEEVADQMVPNAMWVTAAMIRFFYSQVDSTPPGLSWRDLGAVNNPLVFPLGSGGSRSVPIELIVDEPTSGVDQDGFKYFLQKYNGSSWADLGSPRTSSISTILSSLSVGDYRVWAKVENGAGLSGESPFGYFTVAIPEPSAAMLLVLGAAWMLGNSTNRRRHDK